MSEPITPQEHQLILQLIRDTKQNGITELSYKDLRIRFNHTQEKAAGPAQSRWNTTLPNTPTVTY